MAVDGLLRSARIGRFLARLGLAAALVAALLPGRAEAQGDDVFTARGVAVDATDQTAAAARVKAIAEGQRRAFRQVLERIIPTEDLPRAPRVTDRQIEGLVQAFEVNKERTSAVRYLAELTVRFKPQDMRQLLQQANVRFAETISRPMIVLPVYVAGRPPAQTAVLWDESNPWRKAWAALPQGTGLVPLIVPIGDLTDADAIDAQAALAGDPARLAVVAQRYRAVETIVAIMTATEDPRSKAVSLQLAMRRQSPAGGTGDGAPPASERPVVVPAGASLDERLAAIARDQARLIEDQWKRSHAMRFGEEQRISVSLPLSALSDLVEARRRLSELSSVRRIDVTSLTRKVARLSVSYSGDAEQLRAAVLQKDMVLTPEPPDWQLKLTPTETVPAAPAAAAPAAGAAARPQ